MGEHSLNIEIPIAVLDDLLDQAMAFVRADMGTIQLLDQTGNKMRIAVSRGFDSPFLEYFAVVNKQDDSACGFAFHAMTRIVVSDINTSSLFAEKRSGEVMREAGVRAVQSTPIIGHQENLIGLLSTHWREPFSPSFYVLSRLDSLVAKTVEGLETP